MEYVMKNPVASRNVWEALRELRGICRTGTREVKF